MTGVSRASSELADRRFASAAALPSRPQGAYTGLGQATVLVMLNITPVQARKAAVAVCDVALRTGAGAAEAREVLAVLGLAVSDG